MLTQSALFPYQKAKAHRDASLRQRYQTPSQIHTQQCLEQPAATATCDSPRWSRGPSRIRPNELSHCSKEPLRTFRWWTLLWNTRVADSECDKQVLRVDGSNDSSSGCWRARSLAISSSAPHLWQSVLKQDCQELERQHPSQPFLEVKAILPVAHTRRLGLEYLQGSLWQINWSCRHESILRRRNGRWE